MEAFRTAVVAAVIGAVVGALLTFWLTGMSNKQGSDREHAYARSEEDRKNVNELEGLLQVMVDDIKTNSDGDLRGQIVKFRQNAANGTYANSLGLSAQKSRAPDLAILLNVISDESLVYIQNCVPPPQNGVLQVGTCAQFIANLKLQAHFEDLNARIKAGLAE